jgi:hypothetical protein
MKKIPGILFVIIFALAGCNDDEEDVAQLPFSYSNMATLIGQSAGHIKQASPGTFYRYVEYVDYCYYTYLFDEITVLGTSAINYYLTGDACYDIRIYTESAELATAQELMLIATQELGEASIYVLHFIQDSTLFEVKFSTYSALWDYIAAQSYTVEDIYELFSAYIYTDYTIYAGGFWESEEFWPFAEIVVPTKKSTAAQPHFRTWKEELKRPPSPS